MFWMVITSPKNAGFHSKKDWIDVWAKFESWVAMCFVVFMRIRCDKQA
jgi:hypothetical protein